MALKKPTKKTMTLSVLMPVYNEEKTLGKILSELDKFNFVHEIIVVNDCSKDKSLEIIKNFKSKKIKYYSMEKNSGKTAAIKKAIEMASGDIFIIQDADLEYDPAEIEDVIKPIIDGHADVVYGSRFLVKKTARVLYFYHYLANKFLTFLSNFLTNLNMTDIETCYKAFKKPIIKNLNLTSKGFGMEVEITAMISKIPIKIYEVPISYYGRTYEEGKKIGLTDGLHAIWYIIFYNILAPKAPNRKKYFKKVKNELGINK